MQTIQTATRVSRPLIVRYGRIKKPYRAPKPRAIKTTDRRIHRVWSTNALGELVCERTKIEVTHEFEAPSGRRNGSKHNAGRKRERHARVSLRETHVGPSHVLTVIQAVERDRVRQFQQDLQELIDAFIG